MQGFDLASIVERDFRVERDDSLSVEVGKSVFKRKFFGMRVAEPLLYQLLAMFAFGRTRHGKVFELPWPFADGLYAMPNQTLGD